MAEAEVASSEGQTGECIMDQRLIDIDTLGAMAAADECETGLALQRMSYV